MKLTLTRKVLILVLVPVVFELTLFGVLVHMLDQVENEREREARARDIAGHVNTLLRYLLEAGTSSVLYHLSSSPGFKDRYRKLNQDVRRESDNIHFLVRNNYHESEKFNEIVTTQNRVLRALTQAHDSIENGDRITGMKAWAEMQREMEKFFTQSDEFLEEQVKTQQDTKEAQSAYRNRVKLLLSVGMVLNVFLATILAIFFNNSTTRRFKILTDNTMRFALGRQLNPPLPSGDEIAHLDKFFREMAASLDELRKKERAVVENAVDVICSVDADGKFTAVNPASLKVWGYTPEDLLGTRLSQIVTADDISHTLDAIQATTTEQSNESFENRIVRQDGGLVDMHWSAHWSAEQKTLFCVAHDVSDRKRIDRMKRDFVAMVSHDLRTPLTSIQGFLSLLSVDAYGELSADGQEGLHVTEANVNRLIALVNDLLDIEKMESGMLQLYPQDTSIQDVVERSVQAVSGFASQQGVGLELPADSPTHVHADADRLVQVMVNLLSNAIKFSPKKGTVKITITDNADSVQVNVADQGRGVPEHLKETIFERFKQAEGSDEREKGGTGLGLAICKAIIERHDGSIGVESTNGEPGSTFWFCIPKQDQPSKTESLAPVLDS